MSVIATCGHDITADVREREDWGDVTFACQTREGNRAVGTGNYCPPCREVMRRARVLLLTPAKEAAWMAGTFRRNCW